MPGYSQLKRLSETILKLGNEINLRAERGEKAVPVPIPDTIEDIDDSEDFVLGMPEKPKPPEPEPEEEEEAPAEEEESAGANVDDLLSGLSADGDGPDLSAFGGPPNESAKSKSKGKKKAAAPEAKKAPEPPPKPKGISGSGYSGFGFDDDGKLESASDGDKKPDIASLMGGPGKPAAQPFAGATGIPELDAILNPQKNEPPAAEASDKLSAAETAGADAGLSQGGGAPAVGAGGGSDIESLLGGLDGDPLADLGLEENSAAQESEIPPAPEAAGLGDFDLPDLSFGELDGEAPESAAEMSDKLSAAETAGSDAGLSQGGGAPAVGAGGGSDIESLLGGLDGDPLAGLGLEESPAAQESGMPPDSEAAGLGDFDLPDLSFGEAAESAAETSGELSAAETAGADAGLSRGGEAPAGGDPARESEIPPASEEPKSDGIDLSDLGDFGDIEIEDYVPAAESEKASGGIDASALFGDDVEDFEAPKKEEEPPPKKVYKPLAIEDDLAILKPDIFTDNPVTKENPPYYVTAPFGKLPVQPEAEPDKGAARKEAPSASAFSEAEVGAAGAAGSEGLSDAGLGADGFNLDDIPEMESSPSAPDISLPDDFGLGEADGEPLGESAGASDDFSLDGIPEMEDISSPGADGGSIDLNMDLPEDVGEVPAAPSADDGFDLPDMDSAPGGVGEIAADAVEAPKSDEDIFNTDGMDFGSFDMPDSFGSDGMDALGGGAEEGAGGLDAATAGALDGFDIQDTDSQLSKAGDDFALEGGGDDFSIPGFSEEGADPYAASGKKGGGLDQVDFSGAVTGDGKTRTQLSEDEYDRFKKNLREYPLNVRIAVEEMIAKNEFTDEVVFEVIEKILKKVTARQLAGHLEKTLDISLPVPRDYERRSAEEYEAYKSSFSYQLKNRILPAAIVGLFAAMILFCLGYLGKRFVVEPLVAESLYKQGYALLENDEFPQSQEKFNEALARRSKKKWFFKYAQGYRQKKQYDRAELFYKNILKRFDHDKQAGLEYARMEVEDLANYELAEEILKREVLDNHVNDPDGILALGDTYLEWATEKDPSKFEDAHETYSRLQQLYGDKNANLYQSRFLRYNIRTDQLRNVLQLKDFFFNQGQKSLGGEDWIELSGYLMDKQHDDIPLEQEPLVERIQDVRDMIDFAVKAAPANPLARYNLSRYFVQVGDHARALPSLKDTEQFFAAEPYLNKRAVYKRLDTYRLLGEEYLYDREFILARKTLTEGIDLFEDKNRFGAFEADKNVGKMYSDVADIDYFISGDLENARRNYQKAVESKNDTPSIRYRTGYIDYTNEDYQGALNNFIKAGQRLSDDTHLALALGNTLSLKGDNYAAQGYYERLLSRLDLTRERYGIVSPQTDERAGDMVELYMKAANNLGVSLFRIARQSGSSSKNAASLVSFQDSIRYYDAMTRNQQTMVRLPGSNLAEMNLRYATNPIPKFEPEIYTEIPRVLDGEKGLEQ